MPKPPPSLDDIGLEFVRRIRKKNFWASVFSGFHKRIDTSVPTLCLQLDPDTIHGVTLVINPNYLLESYYEDEEISLMDFYLAHEGIHYIQRHIPRWRLYLVKRLRKTYGELSPRVLQIANQAADLATNCLCLNQAIIDPKATKSTWCGITKRLREKVMFELLPDICWPHHWGFEWGLSMEQYLDLLLAQEAGGGAGATGEGSEGIEGPYHPWINNLDDGIPDSLLDGMERRTVETIREAVRKFEAIHGRGTAPGVAKEILTPPVEESLSIPWQMLERQSLRGVTRQHEAELWSRPNRRLAHLEDGGIFPFPSWEQHEGPRVAFVIDTSGSMALEHELMEAYQIVLNFLSSTEGGKFWIVHADTKPAKDGDKTAVFEIKKKSDIPTTFHGRGGTDFVRPIRWVLENLRPDIIKYVTDGQGPAPAAPPPVPMTWFLTRYGRIPYSNEGSYQNSVPYGTVIRISTGEVIRR